MRFSRYRLWDECDHYRQVKTPEPQADTDKSTDQLVKDFEYQANRIRQLEHDLAQTRTRKEELRKILKNRGWTTSK